MGLSHDDVLQILALLDASEFDELRLETNDYKLHVRRSAPLPSSAAGAFESGPAGPGGAPATGSAATSATASAAARTSSAAASPAAHIPVSGSATHASNAVAGTPTPASSTAPSQSAANPTPSPTAAALAEVKTPLLGTFYRSPQPGAPPFVEVGSEVGVDTEIGIVEVMKLMSSVAAGVRGVVVEIAATDGQLVEYGEVLMRIAPHGA